MIAFNHIEKGKKEIIGMTQSSDASKISQMGG